MQEAYMDDASVENGCLWVIPGSHKRGIIYPHREHEDERFDCVVESFEFPYKDDDSVPVFCHGASLDG